MELAVTGLWPRGLRHGAKDVGHTDAGRCLALYFDLWDTVRLRTVSTHWDVPRKCGPHGELFFFLKKEPMVLSELIKIRALHLSRNSESMCLGRSAHCG